MKAVVISDGYDFYDWVIRRDVQGTWDRVSPLSLSISKRGNTPGLSNTGIYGWAFLNGTHPLAAPTRPESSF